MFHQKNNPLKIYSLSCQTCVPTCCPVHTPTVDRRFVGFRFRQFREVWLVGCWISRVSKFMHLLLIHPPKLTAKARDSWETTLLLGFCLFSRVSVEDVLPCSKNDGNYNKNFLVAHQKVSLCVTLGCSFW